MKWALLLASLNFLLLLIFKSHNAELLALYMIGMFTCIGLAKILDEIEKIKK